MKIGALEIGQATRTADGYAVGGDVVVIEPCAQGAFLAIVDVLGHGPAAHAVGLDVERILAARPTQDVAGQLTRLDAELRGSLGAAVGLAYVDAATGEGAFSGVGNTVARLLGEPERRLVSLDGVVGQSGRTGVETPFRLARGQVLVLYTDGVTSRFAIEEYPRLLAEEPAVAAAEIIRRFGRSHDDAACIVARLRA